MADLDLGRLPDRDSYEVVGHAAAVRVLDAIAEQRGSEAPDLPRLMASAREHLARDWRAPFQPDGLVLLRRLATQGAIRSDLEPTLTPSQMKKLTTKPEWIEIVVADQDGVPYPGRYRIQLPDGVSREGSLDEAGFYGNYDPGNCVLILLDRTQPRGAGGGGDDLRSLPVTLGDDIRLPDDAKFTLVGGGESVAIPLADKLDVALGVYAFSLEPLRPSVLYTGVVSYGDTSTTMFRDDDLYTRAGGGVDQPLDFDLDEPEHQTQAGDPAAPRADPPMPDQTHADHQQASQVPDNETCAAVPGAFSPHVGTEGDN